MKSGVRLGVDVGDVRVGVAVCDHSGVLATPLLTLQRRGSLVELARLVKAHEAVEVVVGLPRSLSGAAGPAEEKARRYASELAARIDPTPVHLADERLSTVLASRTLAGQGVRGRRQRAVVDQAAAVVILQAWLDSDGGRRGSTRDDA